jgi:hypothetical protein
LGEALISLRWVRVYVLFHANSFLSFIHLFCHSLFLYSDKPYLTRVGPFIPQKDLLGLVCPGFVSPARQGETAKFLDQLQVFYPSYLSFKYLSIISILFGIDLILLSTLESSRRTRQIEINQHQPQFCPAKSLIS